ncbi:hypothetical protein NQZ68_019918 [Dissostichus eleginoides]|nr:hypothetical protein NQZ68_019918 [Dissostichus eleginoides]
MPFLGQGHLFPGKPELTFLDLGHRSTGRSLPRCDKKYPANKQRAGAGGNPEHSEHRGGDRTLDHRGISFFYPKKGDVHDNQRSTAGAKPPMDIPEDAASSTRSSATVSPRDSAL